MAEEREKKRKKSSATGEPEPTPARETQDMTAGELLRHTRTEKGMELEEVSSAIHVRVAQLRAIEEGHIESLPGMTYALGFVKSYAGFLKLDPQMVAGKFKAEHSVATPKPDLKFPEPVAESKMPDPVMLGAAVAGVIALLGVWMFFTGGEEKAATTVATAIPPPPGEIAPLTATPPPASVQAPPPATMTATAVAPAAPAATPATAAPAAPATTTTTTTATETPAPAATPAPVAPPTETAAATPAMEAGLPKPKPTPEQQAAAQQAQIQWQQQQPQQQDVINIHQGRGRVILQARQAAWVQVTDGTGQVLLKKVLRPGDRYYVPDAPGLSLVTSNAGGIDVWVDGRSAGTIGQPGEIVRGVSLNPNNLKPQRTRVRMHD